MNDSENVSEQMELKGIRPRSLVFAIISVIFIVLMSTFYMSNRISSTLSQASTTSNGLTVSNITKNSRSIQLPPQKLNDQNKTTVLDIKDSSAISYNNVEQEALFREEENIIPKYSTHSMVSVVSVEDFRVAVHKMLYRESKY